jgi:hypothetical protein
MDLKTLRETISKMHSAGLSNVEIADRLKKQGVKSLRGSRTPTPTMVGYHVRKLQEEAPSPTAAKPTPTVKSPRLEKITLAQKVLATDLPAKDRLELVELLLS